MILILLPHVHANLIKPSAFSSVLWNNHTSPDQQSMQFKLDTGWG